MRSSSGQHQGAAAIRYSRGAIPPCKATHLREDGFWPPGDELGAYFLRPTVCGKSITALVRQMTIIAVTLSSLLLGVLLFGALHQH